MRRRSRRESCPYVPFELSVELVLGQSDRGEVRTQWTADVLAKRDEYPFHAVLTGPRREKRETCVSSLLDLSFSARLAMIA
jgi:hypothetical protein